MAPIQPALLMQYLDDYFAIWSHEREKLEEFLKLANQIDENIEFMKEVEEKERLPFLDVEVIRSNGTLKKKFPVQLQLQAKDWNNEEHDRPKPTLNGCRILGRGAGQFDKDIPWQWLS
ncbi:unnamed protein product [Protopolystoma xenopodis]|uniref:Reverse transcriptase domain-containing protein n=1 Tax=Protopolystoma xenopodis TaxID=117903 RepID=A0A448X511_9PLAT|nr:unnamed protein product [Protopolystoma xenopodis]